MSDSTISENMITLPAVSYTDDAFLAQANDLAAHLGTPVISPDDLHDHAGLFLIFSQDGLSISDGKLSLTADFGHLKSRLRAGNMQKEMLAKAARLKDMGGANESGCPILLDATAGLGEDSFILAAAGFNVKLYEYDPVIAALLKDSHRRALQDPELSAIASRMEIHEENSLESMQNLTYRPDVILLDPMFPSRQKSALVKKKFQLLQQLERPCSEDEGFGLLDAALELNPKKIVIKRPLKGPFLAGRKPHYSLKGKAIRYDCFVF